MEITQDKKVLHHLNARPKKIASRLIFLRQLIIDSAIRLDTTDKLEETFRWNEPSYITKQGSTIRIDWIQKNPKHYAMYFNCKTKLVDTFREIYLDQFVFDGNRAIIFHEDNEIPEVELAHCIALSLTYHRIKHLHLLGV